MIAKNLQKLRKTLTLGQKEFAVKLGINPLTYANYERDERKMPYELTIKLHNEFNVNLNWLICGVGEMFNTPKYEDVQDEFESRVIEIIKKQGLIK